ncbi:unnamed protein product, partial [Effrenium voratum]
GGEAAEGLAQDLALNCFPQIATFEASAWASGSPPRGAESLPAGGRIGGDRASASARDALLGARGCSSQGGAVHVRGDRALPQLQGESRPLHAPRRGHVSEERGGLRGANPAARAGGGAGGGADPLQPRWRAPVPGELLRAGPGDLAPGLPGGRLRGVPPGAVASFRGRGRGRVGVDLLGGAQRLRARAGAAVPGQGKWAEL